MPAGSPIMPACKPLDAQCDNPDCWHVLLWTRCCSFGCSYLTWSLDDHLKMLEWGIKRGQMEVLPFQRVSSGR